MCNSSRCRIERQQLAKISGYAELQAEAPSSFSVGDDGVNMVNMVTTTMTKETNKTAKMLGPKNCRTCQIGQKKET